MGEIWRLDLYKVSVMFYIRFSIQANGRLYLGNCCIYVEVAGSSIYAIDFQLNIFNFSLMKSLIQRKWTTANPFVNSQTRANTLIKKIWGFRSRNLENLDLSNAWERWKEEERGGKRISETLDIRNAWDGWERRQARRISITLGLRNMRDDRCFKRFVIILNA